MEKIQEFVQTFYQLQREYRLERIRQTQARGPSLVHSVIIFGHRDHIKCDDRVGSPVHKPYIMEEFVVLGVYALWYSTFLLVLLACEKKLH